MNKNVFKIVGILLSVAFFIMPNGAQAERLWSSGCELQVPAGTATMSDVEFVTGGTTLPTVETGIKRSGAVSCKATPSSSSSIFKHRFSNQVTQGPYFVRFYIYIPLGTTFNNNAALATYVDAGTSNARSVLVLKTDRTLAILNDSLSQVATYTAQPLAFNTWYRVEYRYAHTNGGVQVRLDGVEIMRQATGDNVGVNQIELGLYNPIVTGYTSGTGAVYFDDIAVNNSAGENQNAFPGGGSIVHLRPNAAGDVSNCFSGTWQDIDEGTPSGVPDVCTFNVGANLKAIDVNIESLSASVAATVPNITLVQVGAHVGALSGGASTKGAVYARANAGAGAVMGTTTYGSPTYYSHSSALPRNYALTLYGNPSTNCYWETTGSNSLDALQIGYESASSDLRLNTLWALVEYSSDPTFREPCNSSLPLNIFEPITTALSQGAEYLQSKGIGFWAPAIAADKICFGNANNCTSSWYVQPKCRLETYRVAARPNSVSFPSWGNPDFSVNISTALCDDMLSASSKAAGWVSTGFDYANRVIGGFSYAPRACYFMRLACDTDIQLVQGLASQPEAYPIPDFTTSTIYKCSNLIDDDGDGLIDHNDPECLSWDQFREDIIEGCPSC